MTGCPSSRDVVIFRHPYGENEKNSRALLLRAAAACTGLSEQQLGAVEQGEWGKPFFSGHPELQFSITHSGTWWLCAFSGQPVGLDVQLHQTHLPPEKLSRRFFHPMEDAFLAGGEYRQFFDLWSAKESWVKFTGRGLYDGTESFSVVSAEGAFPAVEGAQLRLLPFEAGYSLCLCARQIGGISFCSL